VPVTELLGGCFMNVEELRRMLTDDFQALREGKSVLGVGEMADEVEKLGSTFTANAQRIRSYENAPKLLRAQYAVVLGKLERPSSTRDAPGLL
jgi:hypothetical protein